MRNLHPFRDTPDADSIGLEDIRRALCDVLFKDVFIVNRFTDSDRDSRFLAERDVALHIVRLNRFLKPEKVLLLQRDRRVEWLPGRSISYSHQS